MRNITSPKSVRAFHARFFSLAVLILFVFLTPSFAQTGRVQALFDLEAPEGGPFPSDRFTMPDTNQNTGLRVNLPKPDCSVRPSDCEDIEVLNTLDGFNMQPRLSIPFDGPIDAATVSGETVFLISLGDTLDPRDRGGKVIGINQVVWDPSTNTLHARSEESLDQHTRYALVVTRGIRDESGAAVEAADAFRRFRHTVRGQYKQDLLDAIQAARRAGVREEDVAVASVFTTQSFSYATERVREAVQSETAPTLNFGVGPGGARAVFNLAQIVNLTNNAQISASGPLTAQPFASLLATMRVIPGAVGTVAFGTFRTPDFTTRATGHIEPTRTRTGTLAPTGSYDVAFALTLPAGSPPAGGWPVAICLHGSGAMRLACLQAAPVFNSHGVALLAFNLAGHGFGARTTTTVGLTGGTSMTFAAPGNGYDRDGNGTIDNWEPQTAAPPYALQGNTPTSIQSTAMLLHLVRGLQAGVDVNGDGVGDLDGSRIYLFGQSYGNVPGMMAFAVEPAIRSAAFIVAPGTMVYNTQLSPTIRPSFGGTLSRRTPSLLNSAFGVTSLDGQAVAAPHYNENLPLRNQPPLVNTVPGAISIQRFIDRRAWAEQVGGPVAFAPLLRRAPLAGVAVRPFVFLMARSDPSAVNPGTTAVIRAGDFADRVLYYRHDLNFGLAGVPATPHAFFFQVSALPNFSRVALGAQHRVATMFETDDATVTAPTPTHLWEAPISSPLPEDTYFLPRPR